MPALSREEYLRRSHGEDSAKEHDEQLTGHLSEGPQAPPAPHPHLVRPFAARRYASTARHARPPTARPDRSEAGDQARRPSPGHDRGVPPPKPVLPGSHGYVTPVPAAEPAAPLDVGPAKPYYSGGTAHGVPPEVHYGGRPAPPPAEQMALQAAQAAHEELGTPANPVPVYVVTKGSGARPMRRAALRQVPVAAPGADPVVLVHRNPHRRVVSLLNESANTVRITADPTSVGGALLPASMTSYKDIDTQDVIYAYQPTGNSGVATISVIDQYDVPDAS